MSALSDLLNDQPVSARQAAEIAAEMKIDLPYGTLAGYWAGKHGRPTSKSLAKLASVIPSLTEKQLQEAAWGTSSPLGPYAPPDEAIHLSERQRRAIDELIRSVVATQGQVHDVEAAQKSDAPPEAIEDQEAALPEGVQVDDDSPLRIDEFTVPDDRHENHQDAPELGDPPRRRRGNSKR